MKLSIVDLGTVAPGTDAVQGLADSLATARHADAWGFHRIWFAEHHASVMGASHHPELLIAAAGQQTRGIRLGSGAVLMNHYSPFKVAEMFKQLEAMYPGRIDLGMGRATGGPVVDLALQRHRNAQRVDDYPQQLMEVVAWLHNVFPDDHPFANTKIVPSLDVAPELWVLGSSPGGGRNPAELGIGYSFAGFINPTAAVSALQDYRRAFQAQGFGFEKPQAMLAINVTVGETSAEAAHLVGSAKAFYARLRRGDYHSLLPTADVAATELTPVEKSQATRIVNGVWPQFVAGSVDEVRATIEQMVEESGADEVMIQNMIADPADRLRSHELLARAFGLERRSGPGAK